MKKLLLLIGTMLTIANPVVSQSIPNSGFESWTTTNYNEPDGWGTSNHENLRDGGPVNVTRVSGVSGFAVRMETVIATDTFPAYIYNGEGDPSVGGGGVPFSQIPTSVTGSYRYSLGANDTALIWVIFKKNGNIIFDHLFPIKGTGSQLTFTTFSMPFPTALPFAPDSVIVAAVSSNAITNVGVTNGSWLELDNLGFGGPGVTQTLPGGNFDNWTANSYSLLNDWGVNGSEGVSQYSPGHSGNYAVQLVTQDYGVDGIWPSGVNLGNNSPSGPSGGIPFNHLIDTLCGYYKYSTSGSDSVFVGAWTSLNGAGVGGQIKNLGPAATWTYFEMEIYSFMVPDTLNISISSSSNFPFNNTTAGSTLILDDVLLKSQVTSLYQVEPTELTIKAFPNPVSELVNLSWTQSGNEPLDLKIYNIMGEVVLSKSYPGDTNHCQLDISELSDGTYLVKIVSQSNTWKTTFVKN